jgi:hypothetical protein
MSVSFIKPPDMGYWSQSIGGLIINFGVIEFLTLRWIQVFDGEPAAIAARKHKLSRRIQSAVTLIAASPLSDADKKRASDLWSEASQLSGTRNRVAHNPMTVGVMKKSGELVLSIIDLQKMTPTGENPLERLDRSQIASIALRVGEIGRDLSAIIESIPNKK